MSDNKPILHESMVIVMSKEIRLFLIKIAAGISDALYVIVISRN
jgi:hypothetical protein